MKLERIPMNLLFAVMCEGCRLKIHNTIVRCQNLGVKVHEVELCAYCEDRLRPKALEEDFKLEVQDDESDDN
jgi:hypothetical protein